MRLWHELTKRREVSAGLRGCMGVFLLLVALPALLLGCEILEHALNGPILFNSAAWKACDDWDGENAPRWRMREDVTKHVKRGMTVAEVHELLGPPDQGDAWGIRKDEGIMDSSYTLLYVAFSQEGRVKWCKIRTST